MFKFYRYENNEINTSTYMKLIANCYTSHLEPHVMQLPPVVAPVVAPVVEDDEDARVE